MNDYTVVRFVYGDSNNTSFLSLLDQYSDDNTRLIITIGEYACDIGNKLAFDGGISKSQYNFAVIGHDPQDPSSVWNIGETADVPLLDTRVLIINNIADAKQTFSLASHVSSVMEYYDLLFKCKLPRYDNVYLSIANFYRKSPYGFFNLESHLMDSPIGKEIQPGLMWDQQTNAVYDVSGSNRLSIL